MHGDWFKSEVNCTRKDGMCFGVNVTFVATIAWRHVLTQNPWDGLGSMVGSGGMTVAMRCWHVCPVPPYIVYIGVWLSTVHCTVISYWGFWFPVFTCLYHWSLYPILHDTVLYQVQYMYVVRRTSYVICIRHTLWMLLASAHSSPCWSSEIYTLAYQYLYLYWRLEYMIGEVQYRSCSSTMY
jgi:hypothetical protein